MNIKTDAKDFWEKKIIGWEDGRYATTSKTRGIEGLADRASSSLRFRLKAATHLLAAQVIGKNVVEIGCGSALLAEKLIDLGAKNYVGYDFADVAVSRGNERLKQLAKPDSNVIPKRVLVCRC